MGFVLDLPLQGCGVGWPRVVIAIQRAATVGSVIDRPLVAVAVAIGTLVFFRLSVGVYPVQSAAQAGRLNLVPARPHGQGLSGAALLAATRKTIHFFHPCHFGFCPGSEDTPDG